MDLMDERNTAGSLTESDVADIVTSLTESGGQGTQLKETLRKLYKNAAFRAQKDGLTGGERDEAIKKIWVFLLREKELITP